MKKIIILFIFVTLTFNCYDRMDCYEYLIEHTEYKEVRCISKSKYIFIAIDNSNDVYIYRFYRNDIGLQVGIPGNNIYEKFKLENMKYINEE